MRNILILLFILMLSSCHCGRKTGNDNTYTPPDPEAIIEMNKKMLKDDMNTIEHYIEGNKLSMEKTGTGLYYNLDNDEEGINAEKGDDVFFSYKIGTLEGKPYYSSNDQGSKVFKVDKTDIESGWNEAAKLMSPGDEGVFILPPHLAFRNIGDGDKIGPGEVLVYELRLDSIRRSY